MQKVSLKSFDAVVAVARAWLEAEDHTGRVSVHATAGKVWKANLSGDWPKGEFSNLLGRVADFKGAYKQLPRRVAHRCFSVIALLKQDGAIEFFEALSLMFGQTAAVYGFLRFSRAISALACGLLHLTCVEFFDDVTQIEPRLTSDSAMKSFESLLDMLGWKISFGDKRLPFSKVFVSLGVMVGLPDFGKMDITLSNKPGRVQAIRKATDKVLSSTTSFGFKDALSFKGALQRAKPLVKCSHLCQGYY